MAYGLPRRKKVKDLLWGSCYTIQDPWDLARFTQAWYDSLAKIKLPFLEEISFGNTVNLKNYKGVSEGVVPSAECVRMERKYEMARLNQLKCQRKMAEEVQSSLRDRPVGLRRPLPPKLQFLN